MLTIICHDNWSKGYFHWFGDFITRLIDIHRKYPKLPIVLPYEWFRQSYIKQTLKLLNQEVILTKLLTTLNLAKCIVYDMNISFMNYSTNAINTLREKLNLYAQEKRTDLIFVSRAKAKRRNLTNEQNVQNYLKSKGFKIIFFEELNWDMQTKISASDHIVVSQHGAGLTNMMFGSRGLNIIKLRRDRLMYNNCFYDLAHICEDNYYYLLCKGEDYTLSPKLDNITVDIHQLDNILNSILN